MESHKEGVLDIFQEHIAFCHDVGLLSKSRHGIRVSGKGPVCHRGSLLFSKQVEVSAPGRELLSTV